MLDRGLCLAGDSSVPAHAGQVSPPPEPAPVSDEPVAPTRPGATALPLSPSLSASALSEVPGEAWIAQGPSPTVDGQTENVVPGNEVTGAIHTVAAHPTDPNTVYVGAINGGIWRTRNATDVRPTGRR